MKKSLSDASTAIRPRKVSGRAEKMGPMNEPRHLLTAQQERSRKTWRALLDAGFSILDEQGLTGLTVPEVSRRAGVSVGTVYRRFGDKEGLLTALLQEFTTSFRDEIHARMHRKHVPVDALPCDVVDVAVRAVVETYQAHERLLRVFSMLGQTDPATFHQGRQVSHEGGVFFRDLIWPTRGLFTHPDAERTVDVAYRLIYAACMHRVVNGPNLESPTEFSWDDLADELVRTVCLHLFGKLSPQS
jgi:AcrR family transcriptional regulator